MCNYEITNASYNQSTQMKNTLKKSNIVLTVSLACYKKKNININEQAASGTDLLSETNSLI